MENKSVSKNDIELIWKCRACEYENRQHLNSITRYIDSTCSWESFYVLQLTCMKCKYESKEVEI